jgi:hypothetical protein
MSTRHPSLHIPFLVLVACTPETDLRPTQAAVASTEATNGNLSSPATDPLAGQLIEPPSGSTGMPTNLASLVVQFTEPVRPAGDSPSFVLRSAAGEAWPLAVGEGVACAQSCYRLTLGAPLAPSGLYTLEAMPDLLQFLDGKPVPAGAAGSFSTGAEPDLFAPRIESISAEARAGCLLVQLVADEPVRADLVVHAGDQSAPLLGLAYGSTLTRIERLPDLPPGIAEVEVQVRDRAGNQATVAPVAVALPPALPRLVLTEILANSAGSETTQEFVEIYNAAGEPLALGGLVIADKTGSDVLPEGMLAGGAFALVVADKYDPTLGGDVAPREGTLLERVPGRIGSDGLSNAGEPVRLLTAAGEVISEYGGWVDVSASAWSGKSVKRTSVEACDEAAAWTATPSQATPGW